jgi:hypothetical protein
MPMPSSWPFSPLSAALASYRVDVFSAMVERAESSSSASLVSGRLSEMGDYVAVSGPSCERDASSLSESLSTTPSTTALIDDPFTNMQEDAVRDADFYRLADYVEVHVSVSSVINKARSADLFLRSTTPSSASTVTSSSTNLTQRAPSFIRQLPGFSAVDFTRFLKIADCRYERC